MSTIQLFIGLLTGESTTGGAALTLNSLGAVNFENLWGTSVAETLTGDGNANEIRGMGGTQIYFMVEVAMMSYMPTCTKYPR